MHRAGRQDDAEGDFPGMGLLGDGSFNQIRAAFGEREVRGQCRRQIGDLGRRDIFDEPVGRQDQQALIFKCCQRD